MTESKDLTPYTAGQLISGAAYQWAEDFILPTMVDRQMSIGLTLYEYIDDFLKTDGYDEAAIKEVVHRLHAMLRLEAVYRKFDRQLRRVGYDSVHIRAIMCLSHLTDTLVQASDDGPDRLSRLVDRAAYRLDRKWKKR